MAFWGRPGKTWFFSIVIVATVGSLVFLIGVKHWTVFSSPQQPISPLVGTLNLIEQPLPVMATSGGLHQKSPFDLAAKVKEITKDQEGTFGIVAINLLTGESFVQNGDEPFYMASTYKIPLVLTALDAVDNSNLQPDTKVGSLSLAEAEDRIITISDNDAAADLASIIGWDQLAAHAKQLGMTNSAFDSNFTTTPNDMAMLLKAIYAGNGMSRTAQKTILNLLAAQQINDRIPKYLPKGLIIAHKTGELDDVRHDVGLVLGDHVAYVIVLMSKNLSDPEGEKDVLAHMSLAVYQYFSTP